MITNENKHRKQNYTERAEMNFDEMTIRQLKELRSLMGVQEGVEPFALPVGSNVVIRTVTMINVGRLVAVGNSELVLEDAAWVADTQRWSDFLKDGIQAEGIEVEPYPAGNVAVGRGALVDACAWGHELPREKL